MVKHVTHQIALLDSQLSTLEEPTPDEHPIIVDVGGKPAEIAHEIVRQLEDEFFAPLDAASREALHPMLVQLATQNDPRCCPLDDHE